MATVQFQAQLEADGTIRVPAGVDIAPGPVTVVVTTATNLPSNDTATQPTGPPVSNLFQQLAELAQKHDWSDMPTDLAENHDYYAHGAPKGIDSQ